MENIDQARKKIIEEIKMKDGTIRRRVFVKNDQPSLTDVSQQKSTDVNEILLRYQKTGELTHLAANRGTYADISEFTDLHTAMSQVRKAQEGFDSLPATLRARFNNEPIKFIEYLQDPKNLDESIDLGLREISANPLYKNPSTTVPSREEASEARKSQKKSKNSDQDE